MTLIIWLLVIIESLLIGVIAWYVHVINKAIHIGYLYIGDDGEWHIAEKPK